MILPQLERFGWELCVLRGILSSSLCGCQSLCWTESKSSSAPLNNERVVFKEPERPSPDTERFFGKRKCRGRGFF